MTRKKGDPHYGNEDIKPKLVFQTFTPKIGKQMKKRVCG